MGVTGGALIAAGHPETAAAAARVLDAGGNAFDAAVAAGFASAIAESTLTSLGGGGFLLAHTREGTTTAFDFFVDTPGRGGPAANRPHFFPIDVHFGGSAQEFNIGMGSVAVPGNLKGYLHVHRRLGRLPLATVVSPALDLARTGVTLLERQAYVIALLAPILTLTVEGRRVYAPRDALLSEGDCLLNPDLGRFLETLSDGGEQSFYGGELAVRIEADMRAGNGLLTRADLASYEVIERTPICRPYRDWTLLTNPPPSVGGALIALSFELLARRRLGSLEWLSAGHASRLVEVMIEVDRRRAAAGAGGAGVSTKGTTHVSIADGEGNFAGMTTSNGEGSGYVVPGTGIMLNNMMGEDDLHPEGFHAEAPGVRVGSMMAPSLLLRDGEVRLVVGSGGSKRIRNVLFQVIGHVADFAVEVGAAVEAPRLHWDGSRLQIEPGFPAATREALGSRWPTNVWSERNLYFGGVQAVSPAAAAADPRRGGCALVLG